MPETLLLLPGMMCDERLFESQIARFSSERPVVVASLSGQSSFAALANDILRNAPPRFALAGLSMGGIAAMEIVRQMPERVTRLALLDTNHLAESEERGKVRDKQIDHVRAGGLRAVMRDEMKPNYLADGPNKQAILDLCMSMAETLGEQTFVQQSQALNQRADQTDTLRSVTVPALIMCGKEDTLCPPARHEMMHQLIAGSTLAIVPGAGHLPPLEQPERTNELLAAWLRQ